MKIQKTLRNICVLTLALAPVCHSWAQSRSMNEAQQIAASVLMKHNGNQRGVKAMAKPQLAATSLDLTDGLEEAFYVFNAPSEGGFAIISADERMGSVLGYCDEGSFDKDNIPDGLLAIIEGYQLEQQQLPRIDTKAPRRRLNLPIRPEGVAPMTTTKWDQRTPFNNLCPEIYGEKAPAGCIPVAMAALLKFYHHNDHGYGYHSYVWNGEMQEMDFQNLKLDWDNMLDSYSEGNYTEEQANAVAQLVYACGVATEADYRPVVTVGSLVTEQEGLVNHFGFDPDMVQLRRNSYSEKYFLTKMLEELNNNRPFLYRATSFYEEIGHMFIVDGYQDDGSDNPYFHINWCWGGRADGYFKLTALAPGLIDPSISDFYGLSQAMILGSQPDNGVTDFASHLEVHHLAMMDMDPKFQYVNGVNEILYHPNNREIEIGIESSQLENWSYRPFNGSIEAVAVGPGGFEQSIRKFNKYDFGYSAHTQGAYFAHSCILPAGSPIGEYHVELRAKADGSNRFELIHHRYNIAKFVVYDAANPPKRPGDLNGDMHVNSADTEILVKYIFSLHNPDAAPVDLDPALADLNGDGEVNVADITTLVNYILGKIK